MLKAASFFAGVGGIDLGFKQIAKTIYANEFDKMAIQTFEKNFNLSVDSRDICNVDANEIPDFDIMLAGFPCQAFSLAGDRLGFNDKKGRGILFFELERIFLQKKPRFIFLENVKNLVGHDHGNTFNVILSSLHNAGYKVKYEVLNSMHYGNIPQNRERIYIMAFRNENEFKNFTFPNPTPLTKTIKNFIRDDETEHTLFYKDGICPFYDKLKESIKRSDTIYQWRRIYVRENKSNVCPTLTANMGTGGHNVPIIKTANGIRKLSPKECFSFQGFPEEYILPDIAKSHLYKQAGNSVVVPIIKRIAKQLEKSFKKQIN